MGTDHGISSQRRVRKQAMESPDGFQNCYDSYVLLILLFFLFYFLF